MRCAPCGPPRHGRKQHALAQTLFRAVHVELDRQAIAKADLPVQFQDLLPCIGVGAVQEDVTSTWAQTPVAQSAHGSLFGRMGKPSWHTRPARHCSASSGAIPY